MAKEYIRDTPEFNAALSSMIAPQRSPTPVLGKRTVKLPFNIIDNLQKSSKSNNNGDAATSKVVAEAEYTSGIGVPSYHINLMNCNDCSIVFGDLNPKKKIKKME